MGNRNSTGSKIEQYDDIEPDWTDRTNRTNEIGEICIVHDDRSRTLPGTHTTAQTEPSKMHYNLPDENDELIEHLRILIAVNDSDEFEKLIKLNPGVDLNAKTRHNNTLLHKAINKLGLKICRILIAHGIDIHAKTVGCGNDNDCIMIASNLLVEINYIFYRKPAVTGSSILIDYLIIEMLIQNGANCNSVDIENNTVLMNMCKNYDDSYSEQAYIVIGLLIDHGLDREFVNNRGETAEQIARGRNHIELANFIKAYQSVPDVKGAIDG